MKESDFERWKNERPLRQESWLEIEGILGIAHTTLGAYLFNHELGQCWIPKRAVKFERRINAVIGADDEYRVLVASWFDWAEKLRLMKEGKLMSDDVFKARNEAEQFFKIGAEARVSVMPKIKTLKGTIPTPLPFPEIKKTDVWDEIFGGFSTEDKLTQLRDKSPRMVRFLDREGTNGEVKKREKERDLRLKRVSLRDAENLQEKEARDKLKIDLRELRGDLRYYIQNYTENLIDPTRKKILALILQKEELGMEQTSKDKRFIQKLQSTGFYSRWKRQLEGEEEETKPEPKGRAIDL